MSHKVWYYGHTTNVGLKLGRPFDNTCTTINTIVEEAPQ